MSALPPIAADLLTSRRRTQRVLNRSTMSAGFPLWLRSLPKLPNHTDGQNGPRRKHGHRAIIGFDCSAKLRLADTRRLLLPPPTLKSNSPEIPKTLFSGCLQDSTKRPFVTLDCYGAARRSRASMSAFLRKRTNRGRVATDATCRLSGIAAGMRSERTTMRPLWSNGFDAGNAPDREHPDRPISQIDFEWSLDSVSKHHLGTFSPGSWL
jgi:hypothetical protein